MLKQQLLNKKNIFLALCAIAVLVLYTAYEFGFLEMNKGQSVLDKEKNQNGSVAVIDSDIIISKPVSNAVVESPLEISGRVRPGVSFAIVLKNSLDQVVATSTLNLTESESEWTPYSQIISFVNPLTPTGVLEMIPQDNGETIFIPLNFAAFQDLPIVNVFFSNIKEDPEVLNCDVVYPVQRRVLSEEVTVPAVLQSLFLGLSDAEVAQGYVNNLPEGSVELLSFSVEEGVAQVDFNEALETGGSCRVMAIRAQITETLKQFDNIETVIISVNGNVEEALQP